MRKEIILAAAGSLAALPIFLIDFLFFREVLTLFYPLLMIGALVAALPSITSIYLAHRRRKRLEENFTIFLRDFVEAVRGGMTIPLALRHVSRNDYGPLSYYVKKMSAQLDWGIPVPTVLAKFSKECGSRLIARIISSVIESHAYGGRLTDVLEALASTVAEVERLRAERRLFVQSQVITGYIIFFVFLGVIIGLEKFLIPSLTTVGVTALPGAPPALKALTPEQLSVEFGLMFRNLIIIQGFFAGLMVGKMAEGEIVAGIKHSIFMIFAGLFVFLLIG